MQYLIARMVMKRTEEINEFRERMQYKVTDAGSQLAGRICSALMYMYYGYYFKLHQVIAVCVLFSHSFYQSHSKQIKTLVHKCFAVLFCLILNLQSCFTPS